MQTILNETIQIQFPSINFEFLGYLLASDELPDINPPEIRRRLKKQDPSSDEDVIFIKEEKR